MAGSSVSMCLESNDLFDRYWTFKNGVYAGFCFLNKEGYVTNVVIIGIYGSNIEKCCYMELDKMLMYRKMT